MEGWAWGEAPTGRVQEKATGWDLEREPRRPGGSPPGQRAFESAAMTVVESVVVIVIGRGYGGV